MTNRHALTRRHMIRSLVGGSILMPGLLSGLFSDDALGSGATSGGPLDPRTPHHAAKAKRVIFLYMSGGVSHMDSFDPKPRLNADHGKPSGPNNTGRPWLRTFWDARPRGQCGTEVSDLFPHVGSVVDDLCVIRSLHGNHEDHFQATLGIHTGSVSFARPSIGSWVSYGLGTENQNLPSFVVLAPQLPYAGTQVWSSDFLPGCHGGLHVTAGEEPVPTLARRSPTATVQELELGLLDRLNRRHQRGREANPALAARIRSFETAFGMQMEMPEALDLSKETDATLALYGVERGKSAGFGWQCLVARRLAERGVRFIELIDIGSSNNWDAHSDMLTHAPLARNVDQAIAGLIRDLKGRGMLDDTLVVWTTEFGRTPWLDGKNGRSHYPHAFSSWMAGGGVKPGIAYGKTDEHGRHVVEDPVHVHDFHATILHLLGFDHERLTYRHAGRDFRLTDVSGQVVTGILA